MFKSFSFLLAAIVTVPTGPWIRADEIASAPTTLPATLPVTRPVVPKPLSGKVKSGLDWLVKMQLNDGGWGQGDESQNMGTGMENLRAVSNVADTCMAVQALMRSGGSLRDGDLAPNLRRAVEFVCSKVSAADNDSLYVTDVRGTRVQTKIGTYVDTFLAAQTLSDVKGKMPDDASNARVAAMLDKTLRKIEKNQQKDGGFAQAGWAPVLGEGLAAKAMNQAAARGEQVSDATLKRFDDMAKNQYNEKSGAMGGGGSAGVELYARAANSSNFANASVRLQQRAADLETTIAAPTTSPGSKDQAVKELGEINGHLIEARAAQDAVVNRMNDKAFTDGFGSNGGEEFLSYLNIGEAMVMRGDAKFAEWDEKMTGNLTRVQNDEGSWSGHHCITGKTFCTSAALMVLMVDRTTTPVSDPLHKR